MNNEEYKNRKAYIPLAASMLKTIDQLNNVNIIVAGKSGVGKSTLINTFFAEYLAETGRGEPVTDDMILYEKNEVPIKIYDTIGLELNSEKSNEVMESIYQLINDKRANINTEDDVHFMWYCVSAHSDRLEQKEIDFIREVSRMDVPVILVLTKVYDNDAAQLFDEELRKYSLPICEIVHVLSESTDEIQAFGLDELAKKTSNLIPEVIKIAYDNLEKNSLASVSNEAIRRVFAYSHGIACDGIIFRMKDVELFVKTIVDMTREITEYYNICLNNTRCFDVERILSKVARNMLTNSEVYRKNDLPLQKEINLFNDRVKILETIGCSFIDYLEDIILKEIDPSVIDIDKLEFKLNVIVNKNYRA